MAITEAQTKAAHDEAIKRIEDAYGPENVEWTEPIQESPGAGQRTSTVAVIASNGVGLAITIEQYDER